jgi:hypothetical protein
MIRALALTSHRCVELILDPTPPPSARLCYTRPLAQVGEYVRTIHVLTLNTLATPFYKTTAILRLFHPLVESLMISILRRRLFYFRRHLF